MNTKLASLILVLLLTVIICGLSHKAEAQRFRHPDSQPQSAILLSQAAHNDFAKAIFNFQLGLRGDSQAHSTMYDIRYGGLSYDRDDRFDVPIYHGSRSKIIDLGALNWAEVFDVPILYANPEPYDGGRSDSYWDGQLVRSLPENTMVKVVVGHMYLLHTKDKERDLYVMFRVESLKTGDEVTITWKVVPSPENDQK
jgi:hypothetical protein